MDKKKTGHVCAARDCRNKRYNSPKSFFSFPKDLIRTRTWVINSHREDLIENLNNLHKTHRLCGDHFDLNMFTNKFCNRLKYDAIPTIFPEQDSLRGVSAGPTDHDCYTLPRQICLEEVPAEKIKVLQNVIIPGCGDTGDNVSLQCQESDGQDLSIIVPERDKQNTPPLQSPTACTQTSSALGFGTPRKRKYREQIKILTAENKILMKRNKELEEMLKNAHNNASLQKYKDLTYQKRYQGQKKKMRR